ncbi:ubiquitin fusion degradation protein [Colletotrichum kahawae]|uniref:Ubiquitin fusion degradation protein n=1 Tax=Colletotrichum kahawae TaxID=34407 RepID=A0AAE0DAH9_COLKA|nr:ubiquitin fusion degradation protein [Colletotrichum kahawae]
MLQDVDDAYTLYENPPTSLINLLYNPLILAHTAPHLSAHDRLSLASTSRSFRDLVTHTPGVFRHLDLTQVRTAQFDIDGIDRGGEVWRNVQLDENLTEDDFYSGPLRGIFSSIRRRNILQDVQTLVLDGLSVTAELCHEIIHDPSYSVRILSIRGAKNLNERRLCGSLQHACRPSRPEGLPRLKGLYIFGAPDSKLPPMTASGVSSAAAVSAAAQISAGWNAKSQHALSSSLRSEGDEWYQKKGRIITRPLVEEWANTLVDCHGIIAFDAVPCSGPHHFNSPAYGKVRVPGSARHWAVATVALGGCAGCGASPEGMTVHKDTPASHRPLLAPPPVLTSSIKAATTPQPGTGSTSTDSFVARCLDCLRERYCAGCNKWWCEECYQTPSTAIELAETDVIIVDAEGGAWVQHEEQQSQPKIKARITKSCWECGSNCHDCIERTQRLCRGCCGGYCLVHNEGSTSTFVRCSSRGRFLRHL